MKRDRKAEALRFQSLKAAKRLDDYYIPTRYPNGLPGEIPFEYYDL